VHTQITQHAHTCARMCALYLLIWERYGILCGRNPPVASQPLGLAAHAAPHQQQLIQHLLKRRPALPAAALRACVRADAPLQMHKHTKCIMCTHAHMRASALPLQLMMPAPQRPVPQLYNRSPNHLGNGRPASRACPGLTHALMSCACVRVRAHTFGPRVLPSSWRRGPVVSRRGRGKLGPVPLHRHLVTQQGDMRVYIGAKRGKRIKLGPGGFRVLWGGRWAGDKQGQGFPYVQGAKGGARWHKGKLQGEERRPQTHIAVGCRHGHARRAARRPENREQAHPNKGTSRPAVGRKPLRASSTQLGTE
jgi:hypothetical protein